MEETLRSLDGEERRVVKAVQRLEEEEFLQTKTIPLDTTRGELELWKEAIAEEYVSLTAETPAIKPLSAAEARRGGSGDRQGGVH